MDFMNRHTDYPISEIIFERWSPRAFASTPIDEQKLKCVFEAARWAPSCFNEQPWKFIAANTEADRARFLEILADSNRVWAKNAPVLIALISRTTFAYNGKPNRWNGFDAGCAWGFLALEARRQGLYAHAMGGFDKAKAKAVLNVPEDYEVYAMIALGELGDTSVLPQELAERELPADRKDLEEVLHFGGFPAK